MTFFDRLPFLLFLAFVVTVYVLATGAVLRAIVNRLRGVRTKVSQGRRVAQRTVLVLAGLGLGCGGYAFLVEPNWPEITRIQIHSAKLPKGMPPLRIAQISDLHCEAVARLEARLPELIAKERPDLIVFTGDALNTDAGLPILQSCMKALTKIAPVYAVRGNWDGGETRDRLFAGTGVRELNGEAMPVPKHPLVWVAGSSVGNPQRVRATVARIPPAVFSLYLCHSPDLIEELAPAGVDLVCAGHTHGGQVALPFYGALVTFSKFGKRFESGLYRVKNSWLYVNRGIGLEGSLAPRVRFAARPEITIIELNGTGPAATQLERR